MSPNSISEFERVKIIKPKIAWTFLIPHWNPYFGQKMEYLTQKI